MRIFRGFRGLFAALAIAIVAVSYSMAVRAQSLLTVGFIADRMRGLITQANNAASDLIAQGNNAAAQQQYLLAGLLQGTLDQMQRAYNDQMKNTVQSLGGLEKDAFNNLNRSLDNIGQLEGKTAADLQATVQQSQSAANQVLSMIPLAKRYPVFSGMEARDVLTDSGDQHPDDLRLVGFWLIDPEIRKKPELYVVIDGKETPIPSVNISAYFDHVEIQLPDEVKRAIRFQNSPCSPRKTLHVRVRFFPLRTTPWYKPWKDKEEDPQEREFNVLAGNEQFEATLSVDGTTTAANLTTVPFSSVSPNTEWSCEQNQTAAATFSLPEGAVLDKVDANWSDLGGRYENKGCQVHPAGTSLVGDCSVRGGNKDCIPLTGVCNCSGGGNGKAHVFGTYKINVPLVSQFSDKVLSQSKMSKAMGSDTYLTLPALPGTRYSTAKLAVRRANARASCAAVHDNAVVNLPENLSGAIAVQTVTQTSANGEFEVRSDQSQVVVKRLRPPIPLN